MISLLYDYNAWKNNVDNRNAYLENGSTLNRTRNWDQNPSFGTVSDFDIYDFISNKESGTDFHDNSTDMNFEKGTRIDIENHTKNTSEDCTNVNSEHGKTNNFGNYTKIDIENSTKIEINTLTLLTH